MISANKNHLQAPKSYSNRVRQRYLLFIELQRLKRRYRAFCKLFDIVKNEYQKILDNEKVLEETADILNDIIECVLEHNSEKGGNHE